MTVSRLEHFFQYAKGQEITDIEFSHPSRNFATEGSKGTFVCQYQNSNAKLECIFIYYHDGAAQLTRVRFIDYEDYEYSVTDEPSLQYILAKMPELVDLLNEAAKDDLSYAPDDDDFGFDHNTE